MTRKVSMMRRWTGPPPVGRDGHSIPQRLWPQRRRHKWIVRWFAPDGSGRAKRLQQTFENKADAESFAAQKQSEFDRKPSARRAPCKVTLREFIDAFLALRTGPHGQRLKHASLVSSAAALNRLAAYIGNDRPLNAITKGDAMSYFASLTGLATATVNVQKRTLKAAFNVAVNTFGNIAENPFSGIRADRMTDRPVRYVSSDEFAALLAACDSRRSEDARLWWRAFLMVCYTAGLRLGEAIHLTWADVDFASDTIRVAGKAESVTTIEWAPKDFELRTIPVPAETVALLAKIQDKATEGHAYVFLSAERFSGIKAARAAGVWKEGGQVLNNFQTRLREIIKRASASAPSLWSRDDKPTMSVHDLRRTAITNWTKRANIQTVCRLAGHSSIETTRRYYASVTADQFALAREASSDAVRGASDARVTQTARCGGLRKPVESAKTVSCKSLRP